MSEQLSLPLEPDRCACGAPLVGFINCYRKQCDMCILRSGPPPGGEDAEPKRAALRAWLRAHASSR